MYPSPDPESVHNTNLLLKNDIHKALFYLKSKFDSLMNIFINETSNVPFWVKFSSVWTFVFIENVFNEWLIGFLKIILLIQILGSVTVTKTNQLTKQ